jgi:acyl-coenzyme A thioesterase PaaI-like protein
MTDSDGSINLRSYTDRIPFARHLGFEITKFEAAAARSETPEIGVVTIEMKTTFMAPSVGPLIARGSLLHRTATMGFTEAKIYDAQERVCAHATGTFKYVKRRLPTGPASANAMRPPSTD